MPAVLLCALLAGVAQLPPPEPPPRDAAVGAAQQPTLEQRTDRLFRGCARPGQPGGVVLVARGDDVLLRKAYGLMDVEREVAMRPDAVFDIGSTSKQFTATCLLLLAQEGALSLDDPVRQHVDELPECCAPVTLRHLMLHTSGLPDYIGRMLEGGHEVEDRTGMDEALESLVRIDKLEFPPGTRWQYSNSNYLLLSIVVEGASGQALADFAAERIFTPLGMRDTHVHRDCTALVPRRALSYSRGGPGGWRWNFSNWEQTGDGAVFTTVDDLLRWSSDAAVGVVGGDALRAALARPGALDDGGELNYGAGLIFERETFDGLGERLVVSHGGAWAAYRAELLRVPEERLTVICLLNRDDLHPDRIARRIAGFALGG